MAHNIEIRTINGVETASFIENGKKERAWHGLGKVYDRPLSALEAIHGCNADFEVGLQPILGATPMLNDAMNGIIPMDNDSFKTIDGKTFIDVAALNDMIINGRKATMRLDLNETLGVVSDAYGVVQYKHAFDFVDMLTTGELGGEVPTIECAGLLGRGERVFITAKFPEPIRLDGKDDVVDMYVVMTSSHDGSGAVSCMVTPIRVVCNNTLNMAFRENSGRINFRHTANILNRLDLTNKENANMAYRTLNCYKTYKNVFEAKLEELAKIRLTDKQSEEILAKAILSKDVFEIYTKNGKNLNHEDIPTRSKNIMDNINDALANGIGQSKLEGGTGLWLVNGLTTYYQNNMSWKDDEKKFNAIHDGSVQKKLQDTYELIRLVA